MKGSAAQCSAATAVSATCQIKAINLNENLFFWEVSADRERICPDDFVADQTKTNDIQEQCDSYRVSIEKSFLFFSQANLSRHQLAFEF